MGKVGVCWDIVGDWDWVRVVDLEKGYLVEYVGLGGELRVCVGVYEFVFVVYGIDGRG